MSQASPSSLPNRQATLSSCDAILLIINLGIGGAVVAGAITFYYIGLILGLFFIVLGGVASIQASYAYSRLAIETGNLFPEDIALTSVGRKFQRFTNLIQALMLISASILILYIGATSLTGSLFQIFNPSQPQFWMSKNMCLLYIAVIAGYFAFAKEIKEIRCAAQSMFLMILLFFISLVIYSILNYQKLRENYSSFTFSIPLWPQFPAIPVLSKISILYVGSGYQFCSMPIVNSMKKRNLKNATRDATIAIFIILSLFTSISLLAIATLGELVTTRDIITRVLSVYSRSWISLMIQLIYSFLSIFHVPIYIFSARQSLLQFFYNSFKFAQLRVNESQEETRLVKKSQKSEIMYKRVPRWLFYLCAFLNFLFILVICAISSNILPILEIFVSPGFIYTSFAFPNICLIGLGGWRKEKWVFTFLIVDLAFCIFTFVISLANIKI